MTAQLSGKPHRTAFRLRCVGSTTTHLIASTVAAHTNLMLKALFSSDPDLGKKEE